MLFLAYLQQEVATFTKEIIPWRFFMIIALLQ